MTGPGWGATALAAVMIVIAIYCAARLAMSVLRRRETEVDADAVHAVMGVAMAAMLVPRLSPLPGAAWEAAFGAGAVWFGWRSVAVRRAGTRTARRCPHPLPHLVECVAMLYMLLALPGSRAGGSLPGGPRPGMAASGAVANLPALPAVLALFMVGYVVWTADRLTALARAGHSGGGASPVLAPRLAACSKIAMSMTMGYMLVLMI